MNASAQISACGCEGCFALQVSAMGNFLKSQPTCAFCAWLMVSQLKDRGLSACCPSQSAKSGYSPLWDANLAQWTPQAVAAGLNVRQTSFPDLRTLAAQGLITAPDGSKFGRSGFLINCPAISIQRHG